MNEREINSKISELESIATRRASKKINAYSKNLVDLTVDGTEYEYTPKQLNRFMSHYKEYIRDNRSSYNPDKESQDKLFRKAREDAKKKMESDGYKPNAKGGFKLNKKE